MSLSRFELMSEVTQNVRNFARLLYISTAKYAEDWLSVPHTHACAELFYITGGQGSFLLDGQSFDVGRDDLIIINPFVEHTEKSTGDHPLEYIVVGVDGLELSMGDSNNQPFYVSHFHSANISVRPYLHDLLSEAEKQLPGHETICQDLLEILILRLVRSSNDSARLVPSDSHVSKESAAVRRYIDNHFKEPLTLDLLAAVVHVNKFHMAHNFTRDYGISPINYLLSLRLRESQQLLQSTHHSMAQIARIVGFSSSCYFSQVFKKATGLSPSEYRTNARITSKR